MPEQLTLEEITALTEGTVAARLALDEGFWARVANLYERDDSFVQLNYGYYHPAMLPVLAAQVAAIHEGNRRGSQYKVTESDGLAESVRGELAQIVGVDHGEIALTRSSSESINQVLQGLRLTAGDEIVASNMDYVAVQEVLAQRVLEDGIVVRYVQLPEDPTEEGLVARFASLIGPRTKLIIATAVIHTMGRHLPVAELCALARQANVPIFVDGAHSLGQMSVNVGELGCDFFCASLHKWVGAPLGNGLLAVRKDRISSLRPLFGDVSHAVDDIRRFERSGNRSDAALVGLKEALRWHRALGPAVKGARLGYLHAQWADAVAGVPGFRVHSPGPNQVRGAIGIVTIDGFNSQDIASRLFGEWRLFTSVQAMPWGAGVRVVPGMPTSAAEIDRLIEALLAIQGGK